MDESLREKIYVSYGDFTVKSILNTSEHSEYVFRAHWHDSFEILQIYEREINIEYLGKRFVAVPGDIVIFGSNQIHDGYTGEHGCVYRALQFKWEDLLGNTPFELQMTNNLLNNTYSFQTKIRDSDANKLFDDVVRAHDAKGIEQPIAEKGAICRLIAYLMQHYMNSTYFYSNTDERFSRLLDYIKGHFTENLNTKQLSELFSYSESHLCRKFKKNIGLSLTDYIHMCRIEYAQNLIKQDNMDLTEISEKCGYNSYTYFCRKFRQFSVIAPNEWRNRFVSKNYTN